MLCKNCHIDKAESEFRRLGSGRLTSCCVRCLDRLKAQRDAQPPEKRAARLEAVRQRKTSKSSQLAQDRLAHIRLSRARTRARKRGIPWALTTDQFARLVGQECYYCDGHLGRQSETGSGLDRLDNTKGYEVDNVVPCCKVCNSLKLHRLSAEEMLAVADLLIRMRRSKPRLIKPSK